MALFARLPCHMKLNMWIKHPLSTEGSFVVKKKRAVSSHETFSLCFIFENIAAHHNKCLCDKPNGR
jgi:hypothetical protein